jgi:undecaprenyl-diphosphatase
VAIYFWKDWLRLLSKGFTDTKSPGGRLFWYLVLATIPGAVIGYLLEKQADTIFRNPALIAFMLVLPGVILYWADRRGTKKTDASHITLPTGLLLRLTREGATRFSFLL